MSNTVFWDHHACSIVYADRVTFSEFMGTIFDVHKNEDYNRVTHVIHDMTRVTDIHFSDENMIEFAAHELGARYTNANVQLAVVSTNPAMCAATKMFYELTKLEIGIFPKVAEAMVWVNQTQIPA